MNTQEKLTAIRDKCVELLAIAEKRTQGKWEIDGDFIDESGDGVPVAIIRAGHARYLPEVTESGIWEHNAAYIAACAGPAEAACRSTIAAIDICRDYDLGALEIMAQEIITAWEGIV